MTPDFATLYLMRHGEPALTGRMLGRTDCDATPAGIAACVVQAADLDVAHIVSSDLERAAACAQAIADGRPVACDPRWRELDFGAWDGQRATDIDRALAERFWADPDAAPPPGGERWSALVARVAAAIDALPAGPTLVVTHGGAIRAALSHLCGLDTDQVWAIDLPYAVVVALRIWPDTPRTDPITAKVTGQITGQITGLWP